MLRSEWNVFADSIANSLASSIGGSSPQILSRTQSQQLPSTESTIGGLVLSSTMLCKGFSVCVVAGLSRISSSISTGTVYVAEAGVMMMPIAQCGHRTPSLAQTSVAATASTPVLSRSTPLSIHFALRGR
jgi:hypothetical protein